ncbi:MAG: hypothetical protein QF797_05290 [Alphaproteobacteria bacterium]|nr:hypothetical protein [Alphaproteobacteria bacterium]
MDGTTNYLSFAKSYQHYEVAKHMTIANMGQLLGYGTGINLKLFNSMPAELQGILVKTSEEYIEVYGKNIIEDSSAAKKAMAEGIDGKKLTFHTLSDEERARWAATAESFTTGWLEKMKKKGIDGERILAVFRKTRDKYAKELSEKGYPWNR